MRPDHADFFLVARAFGKHAQLEQGPPAAWEIQHHKGVVQDVGLLVGVAFVQVVVVLPARGVEPDRVGLPEFVVMICGDIMTMPGLPKEPASMRIFCNMGHGEACPQTTVLTPLLG